MGVAEKPKVRFGPFEVDLRSGEVFKHGVRLKLQPQPIQVLSILLETPGEVVTREELQKRLWPQDTFVDFEQGLNTAIKKLRHALGDEAEPHRYIETLPKKGYRFIRELSSEEAKAADVSSTPLPMRQPTARRHLIVITSALIFIIFGFTVVFKVLFPSPPRVVNTRRLTYTSNQKYAPCYLATDGSRVYFLEHRNGDRWVLSQVSITGGEISDIGDASWCLLDISPSGSELLTGECCPDRVLSVPLPAAHATSPPRLAHWAAWIPDGKSILYSENGDKELVRVSADGKTQTRLFATEDISWLRVSPDGRRIRWTVTIAGHRLWEAAIDGSNPHPMFPDKEGQTAYGNWTTDGKVFFFYRREGGSIRLWAKRESWLPFGLGGSRPTLLYAGPLQIFSPVASKSSKELFAVGADLRGELCVYDPRSSTFVPFLNGISGDQVTFSPDHQWIAYVSYPEGALWKSRVDGSGKIQLTFSPLGVENPRWSPDGKFIVFQDWFYSDHRSIYIVPAEGGHQRLLLSGDSEPVDPTWSPDSRSIAYGEISQHSPYVAVLNLNTMESHKVPGSEGLRSPRWSPNGMHIVAHTDEPRPKLRLYSFVDQKWRPMPGADSNGFETWSHDSKYVYTYDGKGAILRANITNDTVETVANLDRVSWTTLFSRTNGWFGLTPDDRIMILRDTGSEDIYALQLDY